MGVFRRLSHAFTGNNLPNFTFPDPNAPLPEPSNGVHLAGETYDEDDPRDRHAYASSSRIRPASNSPPNPLNSNINNYNNYYNGQYQTQARQDPENDYDNASYRSGGRQSYESDFERKSIAPSYLTSARGGTRYDDDDRASQGEEESDEEDGEGGDKYALMTAHLYQRAQSSGWFKSKKVVGMGVVSIRMRRRQYKTFPKVHPRQRDAEAMTESLLVWESAISTLNPEIAIKITSKVVHAIMARLPRDVTDIAIDANTRIQVVDEIAHLAGARKHQFAAFVRSEACLVVWSDEVDTIMESAEALELRMIQYVWISTAHGKVRDMEGGNGGGDNTTDGGEGGSFLTDGATNGGRTEKGVEGALEGEGQEEGADYDQEKTMGIAGWTEQQREKRPVMLFAPLITATAICLNMVFVGSGTRQLVKESLLDGNWTRFALLATTPFTFLLAMFFCICVTGNIWQAIGPIAHFHQNSSYYSGIAPPRSLKSRLPHFTVQMPVYKEGLEAVIVPTIESLKKAITTYERQGGTVSILICEDGMQLWSEADAEVRKAYYDRNAIGWVARPKHGHNGFFRKGRFKKASNMNFACALSLRVEEIMDEIRPVPTADEADHWIWTDDDEGEIYDEALQRALEESGGVAWAAGNIRIGEYILIIDSDTRVPEDCFLDAASELDASPEIAIIQHESDVMLVIGHYFENGIAHFTRRINKAISFCCANGEVAPFVGHNAFLRWSAVQDACFVDPDDKVTKIWSESHVSEDFDMSLRLQMKGYSLRWATYSKGGFKEGVSLTCDDELNRWQKYAYGCSELLFYPFKEWFKKGPVTSLYHTFVWSNIPIHSKVSVTAYISSYYAIAIAAFMSTANWILVGIWSSSLDKFYLESWQVFLTCVVVFCGLSNVCSAIFMYRLKEAGLGFSLVDNFKWLLFFFFFFSGMSWHLTTALVAHLVTYNMTWGSTVKEVTVSNFFHEVPAILKRFNMTYIYAFTNIIGISIMASSLIPVGYRITTMTAILPTAVQAACHILYPITLNPWLMMFNF